MEECENVGWMAAAAACHYLVDAGYDNVLAGRNSDVESDFATIDVGAGVADVVDIVVAEGFVGHAATARTGRHGS